MSSGIGVQTIEKGKRPRDASTVGDMMSRTTDRSSIATISCYLSAITAVMSCFLENLFLR